MAHAQLTHPTRPTLEFRQGQLDTDQLTAEAGIAEDTGTDNAPIVDVTSRTRQRNITGLITAPRQARNSGTTSDWLQALADYAVRLERHVDQFQGIEGYTFEGAQLNTSLRCIYTSLQYTLREGRPYEFEYDATVNVGGGVFETRQPQVPSVTPQTGMDVMATVDGNDLPGFRLMRVLREFPVEVSANFNRTSAENNDVSPTGSTQHQIEFEGQHTGTLAERRQADAALEALEGAGQVTLQTRFPGYALDGKVMDYTSTLEQSFGGNKHEFSLRFLETQSV